MTWWKAVTPSLAPLLLAGCSAPPPPNTALIASPQAPNPALSKPGGSEANPLAGFLHLPTPGQVVAAVPIGRPDPFGVLSPGPAAPGQTAQAQTLPAGFRFTGVLNIGGQAQALVQFGSLSGTLSAGQKGGRGTNLLPAGWSVAQVDGQRGRLVLRQGAQTVVAEL